MTLYGVQQVRDGVMQALGPQLRTLIEKSTRKRWQAFGAGIVVTGMIQSATATAIIVATFAARHLIPVVAALAVLLGADVGTTLVAQVFSIGLNWLGPVFVFVGMVTITWFPHGRAKHTGSALVGLGLMLVGLGTVAHAAEPMESSNTIKALMSGLSSDLFMAFFVGVLITWIAQSSLSIVLLVMSFAAAQVMPLDTAFALVLGTHVGAGISPLLLHMKQRNDARQVVWGSFLMRTLFSFAVIPCIPYLSTYNNLLGDDISRKVVNFHTLSSLMRALIFLPWLGSIAKLMKNLFPYHKDTNDLSAPMYLDDRDLSTPSVGLATAEREALRLGDQVLVMLTKTPELFMMNDDAKLHRLLERDNNVDRLYEQIKFYLAKLSRDGMDEKQAKQHVDLLMFVINLEHIGDIIVHNLCDLAAKKWRNNLSFSKQGWEEIERYHAQVCSNFRLAMNVFHTGDPLLARELVRQKELLQQESFVNAGTHFERLRQGLLESLRSSSLHLDIIRDLRRINDYLTSVAYPVLEAHGILQSRLKEHLPPAAK